MDAFAGNPNLISPDLLLRDGLIARSDLTGATFLDDRVDFEHVIQFKHRLLARAWERFKGGSAAALREPFDAFCTARGHSLLELALGWLLRRPAVASVIAGATTPEQVEANVRAAAWAPSREDMDEIDRITAH